MNVPREAALFLAALLCVGVGGCAGYAGTARPISPADLRQQAGWIAVSDVPLYRQQAEHDCGPSALAMVLAHYRVSSQAEIHASLPEDRRVSAGLLRDRARALGFSSFVVAGTLQDLKHELTRGRPVIVGVAKPTIARTSVAHYEVVVGLHPASKRIATLDPAVGWQQNTLVGFMKEWLPTGFVMIVLLPPEPRHGLCTTCGHGHATFFRDDRWSAPSLGRMRSNRRLSAAGFASRNQRFPPDVEECRAANGHNSPRADARPSGLRLF